MLPPIDLSDTIITVKTVEFDKGIGSFSLKMYNRNKTAFDMNGKEIEFRIKKQFLDLVGMVERNPNLFNKVQSKARWEFDYINSPMQGLELSYRAKINWSFNPDNTTQQ